MEIPVNRPIDLAATLDSGQVFHWSPNGDGFIGTVGEVPAYVAQADPLVIRIDSPDVEAAARYLALDHNMSQIVKSFPKLDKPLGKAINYAPGLRLLRQPRWECLATFITSSLKQVAHIRQISLRLRESFGEPIEFKGETLHSYPCPQAIVDAGEKALRACGLGYRAAFLHRTAKSICDGEIDLEAIAEMDDASAREALCQFHGVGEKIADCVLLFAYERHRCFPIDVWIERVLRKLYFENSDEVTAREIREFGRTRFGKHGGYAQQFLFHYARKTGLKDV
jgi:N-glycosylase/DNA lyase